MWAVFYRFGLLAMPTRIYGLNVRALFTSEAVPLQMAGLTLEGCVRSHRDLGLPICPRGSWVCCGHCTDDSKKFQLGCHPFLSIKKICLDQQHGSARWSRACQRAAQSPRGGVLTTQAARGKMIFSYPLRGRASDLYAAPHGDLGYYL